MFRFRITGTKLRLTCHAKIATGEFAISNLYVDTVNENKLVESAIIEMLAQLDPHSTYSDAEEVKKMNEPLQGNFEGIGVQFQMIEDTLLIVQPVSKALPKKWVFWQETASSQLTILPSQESK